MYRAKHADGMAKGEMQECVELAKLDYIVRQHYRRLVCALPKLSHYHGDTIYEGDESPRLRELVIKARSARCRARFSVSVILFQGKFICRSATLSGGPEIYSRSGFDYFFAGESTIGEQNQDDNDQNNLNNPCNSWVLCDQVRKDNIRLLKSLSVGTIVDFMVEKKKVKFGLNVTSSEKVDKE
ncbi:Myotubularin- protein 14 [Homalodisca vitripennis]|nr:Myotubularin- protein 14 [Homalodisca vitripennis]